jgi:hypothetical protein
VTAAERALLYRAVEELRRVVTAPPPAGTLHYGLFALARLLEEIARVHGPDGPEGSVGDAVAEAALEIAHHVVDHGVQLPRPTTAPGHRATQEEP